MSESPFAKLDSPMLLGQPLAEFACIQCGEAPTSFIAMAFKDEETAENPCSILAYALCARCAALFWDEAAEKFFANLKDAVCPS